jgi:hypothetical protein
LTQRLTIFEFRLHARLIRVEYPLKPHNLTIRVIFLLYIGIVE